MTALVRIGIGVRSSFLSEMAIWIMQTYAKHVDEILQFHVSLYAASVGDPLLIMYVNECTSIRKENMLETETKKLMECPACSTDINRTEHVLPTLE